MHDERGPEANYRDIVLWAVTFAACAATVYGAIIWLIFWLVG